MQLAIIGAGNVGRALAGTFVRARHRVTISSAHPETAAAAEATGASAASSNIAAVAAGDVVMLAVPYPALPVLLDEVGASLRGKIVVDATNPLRTDYTGLATEGTSAAEEIAARVPGARVVKAFNAAFASRQADPTIAGIQADGFVAADDEGAKQTVFALVRSIGFHPVDAGSLEMARALEAVALLNITLQIHNSWAWQSAWKLVQSAEAWSPRRAGAVEDLALRYN